MKASSCAGPIRSTAAAVLQRLFQDEIASPLELDLYIRLPEAIPNPKLVTFQKANLIALIVGSPVRLTLASMNPHSPL